MHEAILFYADLLVSLHQDQEALDLIEAALNIDPNNAFSNSLKGWVLFTFLMLITIMVFLTELMSNVALATIFIPIVIAIALKVQINPLLLSIPVTMAASYAFMMPVATPPNAIVFSSGHITIPNDARWSVVKYNIYWGITDCSL